MYISFTSRPSEVAMLQMLLESDHDTHAQARQKRIQVEDIAKQVEQLHGATEADLKLHSEKGWFVRAF